MSQIVRLELSEAIAERAREAAQRITRSLEVVLAEANDQERQDS